MARNRRFNGTIKLYYREFPLKVAILCIVQVLERIILKLFSRQGEAGSERAKDRLFFDEIQSTFLIISFARILYDFVPRSFASCTLRHVMAQGNKAAIE